MIQGPFEVHLIVNAQDLAALFAFIQGREKEIGDSVKVSCAQTFYGEKPQQFMLTYWLTGDYDSALARVKKTVETLRQNKIRVERTKIEAMLHNQGVPECVANEHYVEFHFKVPRGSENKEKWNHLAELIAPYGAHLFFNPLSKSGSFIPVVTLRRFNTTAKDAEKALEEMINVLKEAKWFESGESAKIQSEYSCLDSDVSFDRGWLYEGDKADNFLKIVPIKA